MTQLEDVPAQLAAEEERVAGKIERAKDRRTKKLHDAQSDKDFEISVHAGKKRTAVRKQRASDSSSPRRSPRVKGVVGEGSNRESPRILAMKMASPPKRKAPAPNTKKPAPKVMHKTCNVLYIHSKLHFPHYVCVLTVLFLSESGCC